MSTLGTARRPRLVFFRTVRGSISGFLLQHLDEHVRALEKWFDVVVVAEASDYGKVCDEHQPDLCVFEVGVYSAPRQISTTAAHPQIPKLGFLHADAFDSSRAAFIADMAAWGVEWFFTTSMSMASYTPELSERLFVWPNAVDGEVFKDYGQPKDTEVLIIGSQAAHYPWRNAVNNIVSEQFGTRTMPHFGWNAEPGTDKMLLGRSYSRLLNTSLFVPTCGTMARDVVRKHLEIPASNACLVTEDTPTVRAMGFRDMENCVFAEPTTISEKLRALLDSPGQLHQITRAGYDLVHSLHTFDQRDQVRQWLDLVTKHGTDMRLVQHWPSGRLERLKPHEASFRPFVNARGRDRTLLQEAWGALEAGQAQIAEPLFARCLNFYFMPEAAAGMTLAKLMLGDAREGFNWATRALIPPLAHHFASAPDPVQWACLIRSFLCRGEVPSALACAAMYPEIEQEELDRIRHATYRVARDQFPGFRAQARKAAGARTRFTVCPVRPTSEDEWTAELAAMLRNCGQTSSAQRLLEPRDTPAFAGHTLGQQRKLRNAERKVGRLMRRIRRGRVQSAGEQWLRRMLAPLKRTFVSNKSSRTLHSLLETEAVDHALLVLPSERRKITRAVRSGLRANPGVSALEVLGAEEAEKRIRAKNPVETSSLDARGSARKLANEPAKCLVFLSRNATHTEAGRALMAAADLVLIEQPWQWAQRSRFGNGPTLQESTAGHTTTSGPGWVLYRRVRQERVKVLKEVGT